MRRDSLDLGDGPTRDVEIRKTNFKYPYLARWAPQPADPAGESVWAVATNLLITFREDLSPASALAITRGVLIDLLGFPEVFVPLVKQISLPNTYLAFAPSIFPIIPAEGPPLYLLAALAHLRQHAAILRVSPDLLCFNFTTPIDVFDTNSLAITDDLYRMGALSAWKMTTGDRRIRVAILDTGVQTEHEALDGNILREKGSIVGGNFYGGNTTNVNDDHGHGTFCAGLVGAEYKAGVNKQVSIMPLKFLDSCGCGVSSDAIEALEFAAKNGAHIISASWGAVALADDLEKKIESLAKAGEHGILFVAGSGNEARDLDTSPFFPAAYQLPNIISVGGTYDKEGPVLAWGRGKKRVHLSAPGETVVSTIPGNTFGQGYGTSAATAYVAGAAALVASAFMKAGMPWTFQDLRQRILDTVVDPDGKIHGTGASESEGRLDLANAVNMMRVAAKDEIHRPTGCLSMPGLLRSKR